MTESILEARDAWKCYGEGPGIVEAVRGASFGVASGELAAIMGPSGSGKTTLLSMLGAMLTTTRGEILIAGRSLRGLKSSELSELRRRHIGFVFQSFNLFPALTARQNVETGLWLRGLSLTASRVESLRALDAVGLLDRAGFLPEDLSGGQKQRVSIARALAGSPSVILADEPTAALDAASGRAVMELLTRRARQAGAAVLVVTHDPRVREFMDRVYVMEDGRVREGDHVIA